MQRSQTELTTLTRKGSIRSQQEPDALRKEQTDGDLRRGSIQPTGGLRRGSVVPGQGAGGISIKPKRTFG